LHAGKVKGAAVWGSSRGSHLDSDTGRHDHDVSPGAVRVLHGSVSESSPHIGGQHPVGEIRAGESFGAPCPLSYAEEFRPVDAPGVGPAGPIQF